MPPKSSGPPSSRKGVAALKPSKNGTSEFPRMPLKPNSRPLRDAVSRRFTLGGEVYRGIQDGVTLGTLTHFHLRDFTTRCGAYAIPPVWWSVDTRVGKAIAAVD